MIICYMTRMHNVDTPKSEFHSICPYFIHETREGIFYKFLYEVPTLKDAM
jgi:hypothetical protein